MSSVAAWIGRAPDAVRVVTLMLEAMRSGGDTQAHVADRDGAALGVTRMEWEAGPTIGGGISVVSDGEVWVAADAALYYRDDLNRALAAAGVRPRSTEPAHLIAAAYRAWGEQCPERLEGDFAFVLYDGARRKALAARDFAGRRPLHFAWIGGGLALASTVGGVLAHPQCSRELNLVALAEDAAGLTGSATETSFRDVSRLPGAHTLIWDEHAAPRLVRHWRAAPNHCGDDATFADSAHHLLALMQGAVRERLPANGPAAIFLSGGWDSPALFAAARSIPGGAGDGDRLRPVSISYPQGDPGREDEIIDAILEQWNSSTHWIEIDRIVFWPDVQRRAAQRDEPFAHAFEDWNCALFEAARSEGCRVALDGYGGDQLFQTSAVFFADLVRAGALRELAREWRAKGFSLRDLHACWQWIVLPLLPETIRDAARRRGRGNRMRSHLERAVPDWLAEDFVRRNSLVEREREHNPVRWQGERSTAEMRWYLENPYFPRVLGALGRLAEARGVEVRSPLFDRRVVEFALGRPRWERSSGRETKRLLRAAVDGLLPAWVLGPRKWRTGTTNGYLARSLEGEFGQVIAQVLGRPLLAEVGIADVGKLRQRVDRFRQNGGTNLGMELFLVAQAEMWLRGRAVGEQLETDHAVTFAV